MAVLLRKAWVASRMKWSFLWSLQSCVVSRACLFSRFTSLLSVYADICSRFTFALWPRLLQSPAESGPSALTSILQLSSLSLIFFIWHLQVFVITVPLSSRICECLVPYFDSSSSDSRNVSLVPGCVLSIYSLHVPWLVFGFILQYCLTACILLINMRQEPNNVPWQWCKTVDFSCFTSNGTLLDVSVAMTVLSFWIFSEDWLVNCHVNHQLTARSHPFLMPVSCFEKPPYLTPGVILSYNSTCGLSTEWLM